MPRTLTLAGGLALWSAIAMASDSAPQVEPGRATELERLVIQDCGSCHGLTLKGGLGRAITPDLMQHYDRHDLRDIILDGIPGTAMPPWRPLMTEADALWIADYLRGETP